MKLHIIRHAKTNQNSPTGRDFDRELLPRGKRQCNSLAIHLSKEKLGSLQVLCSSAVRTRQTWQGIEKEVIPHTKEENEKWYLCDYRTWLNTLWELSDSSDVLIIGHNFGISDLVSYLCGKDVILKTSEYMVLEFPFEQWEQISRDTATICHRYRPEDL